MYACLFIVVTAKELRSLKCCIPGFIGQGVHDDSTFLVMEKVGINLSDYRRGHQAVEKVNGKPVEIHKLSENKVKLFGVQMLNALQEIHKANYVHRDIKLVSYLFVFFFDIYFMICNFLIIYNQLQQTITTHNKQTNKQTNSQTLHSYSETKTESCYWTLARH